VRLFGLFASSKPGSSKDGARSVWIRGEDEATRLMKKRGYKILARNLRLKMGEIDILCLDPRTGCMVVVEVKARVRKSNATPNPEASITAAKKRKLRSLARAISKRDAYRGRPIRIDVVAVEFGVTPGSPPAVRHYESAVGAR